MATDVAVPTLGESVAEATVSKWFKKVGDAVSAAEIPLSAVCRTDPSMRCEYELV